MAEQKDIKSNKWIHIAQNDEDKMVYVTQSQELLFHEAIGMLHDAVLRYETKYKVEIEHEEFGKLKSAADEIKVGMLSLAQLAKVIETTMIKLSAVAQTMNYKMVEVNKDGKSTTK